ncbi:MAG: acyltransferase family protein [Clostridia bacterium]|nr:acyltransferase family protein [Clostridia bacterium]
MQATENSVLTAKQHDYWIDNIKGILMITVVVGHLLAQPSALFPSYRFLYDLINTFHMGTFMILTGYLSKRRVDQQDYLSVVNKNVVPFITSQILLYCFVSVWHSGFSAANATYFDSRTFSFFIPIYQLWYLFAIILYVPITAALKPQRHPLLFLGGALLLSLACGYFKQVTIFSLTKIASYYIFFLLGYFLPKNWLQYIRNKWWVCIPAVLVWVGYIFFISHEEWCVSFPKMFGLSQSYAAVGPMAFGVPAVVGRGLFLLGVPIIALAFYALCPRKKSIFTKLGQNSMYIYVLHALFIVAIRCINQKTQFCADLNTWWLKLAYILGGVAIAFLLSTDWIKKLFKPILEPNFDITNLIGSLYEKYLAKKNQGGTNG